MRSYAASVYIGYMSGFKMGKHGKQMTDGDKTLIISMLEEGYRAAQICKLLGRSKSTVSMFIKRYWSRGCVENRPRSGRPKIVDGRGMRQLSRVVKNDRRKPLRDIEHC